VIRLADVLGALSIATDLGNGQPMGTALSMVRVAHRLGVAHGVDAAGLRPVLFGGLARFLGCVATSAEESSFHGDDLQLRSALLGADFGRPTALVGHVVQNVGAEVGGWRRAKAIAAFLRRGPAMAPTVLATHCEVASVLAARLGLDEDVVNVVAHYHGRFDGRGRPAVTGDQLPVAARLLTVAQVAVVFHRAGGLPGACAAVRARAGGQLDPALVETFVRDAPALMELLSVSPWEALAIEPTPHRMVPPDARRDLARAIGEFADLKSVYTLGHSARVAALARDAAEALGWEASRVDDVEVGALVHDLGKVGVSNGLLDRGGPLDPFERARVRDHAALTRTILTTCAALRGAGELGAWAHERLDGSGPLGLRGDAIGPEARLIAAADVLAGLCEQRPHRGPHDVASAKRRLLVEVDAGRLDGASVDAVLAASEGRKATPRRPAGLTEREAEVLVQVARGRTNKEVASVLGISPRTVQQHTIAVYRKIGVETRAAAALYAARSGLL
jgi:HD-GYP domain-containing protein (c-di-GMP phosphodiesterase class II)